MVKSTQIIKFILIGFLLVCKDSFSKNNFTSNVIFIHPDGASPTFFAAARILYYGPDAELNWDRLPEVAVYKSHIKGLLTATSNAGAVVHAYGVKSHRKSYGLDENGQQIIARSGKPMTILEEAKAAGFSVGIINTGVITEPGTGVFGARVLDRDDHLEIVKQLIMRPDEGIIDVILGGGEVYFLPENIVGRHGKRGKRTDGLNLVQEAIARGYQVVYTKQELFKLSPNTTKLLGIFAAYDTYNDNNDEAGYSYTEEQLRLEGLPDYDPNAPTFAQMLDVAIKILSKNKTKGFYLVAEEEGTDNFANYALNARGAIEATKRADDAIGMALRFAQKNPNTLIITTADSEAGGLSIVANPKLDANGNVIPVYTLNRLDGTTYFTVYLDGKDGTNTPPFLSAPDHNGKRLPFAIAWSTEADQSGGIVARGYGLYADMLTGTIDNTDIYRIKYRALFNRLLP